MRLEILLLFLGMMAVTYIPRVLPFIVLDIDKLRPGIRKTLALFPVTALGALIIPGAFQTTADYLLPGIIGLAAGAVTAWWRGGIVLPVITAVAATYLLMLAGL